MSNQSTQAVLMGLFANLTLALIKITAGIVGHTYALIADGIESTLDVFSSIVVLSGLKIGAKPPDKDHPFGHGKAESLAAMIVAIALICAAAFIGIQAFKEIKSPTQHPATFTLFVLLGVIICKEFLFHRLIKVGKQAHSLSVQVDAWHHRTDAITSIAAFVGIALAVFGGEHFRGADNWAALIASVIIAFNGLTLLNMAVQEIMDAAPDPTITSAIRLMALSVDGVQGIEKCRVRKSGTHYFVELHVEVDGNMTVSESHYLGHKVKDKLIASPLPLADIVIHIEPKLTSSP
jgi:cation diffusion facilitator family transporter